MMCPICYIKKLWIKFKWVEDYSSKDLKRPTNAIVHAYFKPEALDRVARIINQRVGKTVIWTIDEPSLANVWVEPTYSLPDGVDGRAFSHGTIMMRHDIKDDRTFECVLAHELLHILGHWHHGTSWLMQPSIPSCMGLDALLDDRIVAWIKENV